MMLVAVKNGSPNFEAGLFGILVWQFDCGTQRLESSTDGPWDLEV